MRGINLLHLTKAKVTPSAPSPDGAELTEVAELAGPWQTIDEPKSHVRARTAVQVVIAVPLIVLAGLGIKAAVTDDTPIIAGTAENTGLAVDTVAASSTAEYVARNWISLDDPTNRTARLARVWDGASNLNWNGEGSIELKGSTYTAATHVIDENSIDVTVALYIAQGEETAGWIGVLVPMQVEDGAASVRAEPKIVGLPDPAALPASSPQNTDSDLAKDTRTDVERFFTAWAEGDASGVTAPGVEIPTPPGNLASVTVTSWDVIAGSGGTRHGIAEVRLQIGEATLTSSYDVEITRVTSSGGADRWQVTTIS